LLVDIPVNGTTTKGYLSVPETGAGPGVLVMQEWWGLVDHIKDICDRLAEAGFTALAPDMYHGDSATDPDKASRLMMALDVPKVATDLAGAIEYLRNHDACGSARIGVLGFCLGGQLALYGACENAGAVGACIDFYGVHPKIQPDVTKLECPVLGLFAEKDGFVTSDVVSELSTRLTDAGKPHEFKTYEGVDHAFFNDTRTDVYDEASAIDAWDRSIEFLNAHLA